jgi:hypothetical protein
MNEQEQKLLQKYGKLPAKKSMLGGMKVCIVAILNYQETTRPYAYCGRAILLGTKVL